MSKEKFHSQNQMKTNSELKPQDLRIGNILLDHLGRRVKVMELLSDYTRVWKNQSEWISLGYELLKPIPLTEGILLMAGYKYFQGKTEGTLTMDFGGKLDLDYHEGEIKVKSHYEGEYLYRKINIDYLHQLQNFFHATTGEELEINLK